MTDSRTSSGKRTLRVVGSLLAAGSDVGHRRSNNEDAFHVDERGILAVADGLGGLPAGEVASAIAIDTVTALLCGEEGELVSAFAAADGAIRREAHRDASRRGMATTLVIAAVAPDSMTVGHVGDVRAYLLGAGGLKRVTEDHTEAWELVSAGVLSEAEAAHHPYRNSLTRVLGAGDTPEPSVRTFPLQAGDVVLLCSDGLWDPVSAGAIESVLSNRDADASARVLALLDLALAGGGPDNITAVVYQHEPE